jgi:hypothetical protein
MKPRTKLKLCKDIWVYSDLLLKSLREAGFAMIFDQFESVGKASTDFLLNFVKFLTPQERFDIMYPLKLMIQSWNDPAARKLYQHLERNMIYNVGAKKISIEGPPRRCLR